VVGAAGVGGAAGIGGVGTFGTGGAGSAGTVGTGGAGTVGAGGLAGCATCVVPLSSTALLPLCVEIVCVTGPSSPGLRTRIDIAVLPESSGQFHFHTQTQFGDCRTSAGTSMFVASVQFHSHSHRQV
jgi:hypothetical protein